ncbi:MAG: aspartate aminotransferase family protein [Desulfobacterales bacterium]|nr:aspartate aminotransferase family protein [Desulfobacterales bacterium]
MGKGKNIPRSFLADNPLAVRAQGIYIYDDNDKDYIDGCSGALVSNLGHGVKEIIDDLCSQMQTLEFAHPSRWNQSAADEAADLIAELTPGDLNNCWFVSGGSEAVESAVKMARQYFVERDGQDSPKHKLISRNCSYHGATIGGMSIGGSAGRVKTYMPLLNPSAKLPPTYFYRKPDNMTDQEFGDSCANALETEILNLGPENVLAFLAEPIVGSAGGAIVPHDGYWPRVREICDKYDVLLIADEVMTGFGRTGKPFGVNHWNVVPDIIASAKGMAAGYIPTGGIFVKDAIIEAIQKGSGGFIHGHTYNANPLACRAVASVLTYIKKHNLIDQVEKNGEVLGHGLDSIAKDSPFIGDVRGKGYMWAMEIVSDKETKVPFSPDQKATAKVMKACLDNGLIVYPGGCHINGVDTNIFLIAPPLVTTEQEVGKLLDRLNDSLKQFSGVMSA